MCVCRIWYENEAINVRQYIAMMQLVFSQYVVIFFSNLVYIDYVISTKWFLAIWERNDKILPCSIDFGNKNFTKTDATFSMQHLNRNYK